MQIKAQLHRYITHLPQQMKGREDCSHFEDTLVISGALDSTPPEQLLQNTVPLNRFAGLPQEAVTLGES